MNTSIRHSSLTSKAVTVKWESSPQNNGPPCQKGNVYPSMSRHLLSLVSLLLIVLSSGISMEPPKRFLTIEDELKASMVAWR